MKNSAPRIETSLPVADEVTRLKGVVGTLSKTVLQLQAALDSRVVIEQAKGMLAVRLQVDPDVAFERLRRYARSDRRSLHDSAREVVASRGSPSWLAQLRTDRSDGFSGTTQGNRVNT